MFSAVVVCALGLGILPPIGLGLPPVSTIAPFAKPPLPDTIDLPKPGQNFECKDPCGAGVCGTGVQCMPKTIVCITAPCCPIPQCGTTVMMMKPPEIPTIPVITKPPMDPMSILSNAGLTGPTTAVDPQSLVRPMPVDLSNNLVLPTGGLAAAVAPGSAVFAVPDSVTLPKAPAVLPTDTPLGSNINDVVFRLQAASETTTRQVMGDYAAAAKDLALPVVPVDEAAMIKEQVTHAVSQSVPSATVLVAKNAAAGATPDDIQKMLGYQLAVTAQAAAAATVLTPPLPDVRSVVTGQLAQTKLPDSLAALPMDSVVQRISEQTKAAVMGDAAAAIAPKVEAILKMAASSGMALAPKDVLTQLQSQGVTPDSIKAQVMMAVTKAVAVEAEVARVNTVLSDDVVAAATAAVGEAVKNLPTDLPSRDAAVALLQGSIPTAVAAAQTALASRVRAVAMSAASGAAAGAVAQVPVDMIAAQVRQGAAMIAASMAQATADAAKRVKDLFPQGEALTQPLVAAVSKLSADDVTKMMGDASLRTEFQTRVKEAVAERAQKAQAVGEQVMAAVKASVDSTAADAFAKVKDMLPLAAQADPTATLQAVKDRVAAAVTAEAAKRVAALQAAGATVDDAAVAAMVAGVKSQVQAATADIVSRAVTTAKTASIAQEHALAAAQAAIMAQSKDLIAKVNAKLAATGQQALSGEQLAQMLKALLHKLAENVREAATKLASSADAAASMALRGIDPAKAATEMNDAVSKKVTELLGQTQSMVDSLDIASMATAARAEVENTRTKMTTIFTDAARGSTGAAPAGACGACADNEVCSMAIMAGASAVLPRPACVPKPDDVDKCATVRCAAGTECKTAYVCSVVSDAFAASPAAGTTIAALPSCAWVAKCQAAPQIAKDLPAAMCPCPDKAITALAGAATMTATERTAVLGSGKIFGCDCPAGTTPPKPAVQPPAAIVDAAKAAGLAPASPCAGDAEVQTALKACASAAAPDRRACIDAAAAAAKTRVPQCAAALAAGAADGVACPCREWLSGCTGTTATVAKCVSDAASKAGTSGAACVAKMAAVLAQLPCAGVCDDVADLKLRVACLQAKAVAGSLTAQCAATLPRADVPCSIERVTLCANASSASDVMECLKTNAAVSVTDTFTVSANCRARLVKSEAALTAAAGVARKLMQAATSSSSTTDPEAAQPEFVDVTSSGFSGSAAAFMDDLKSGSAKSWAWIAAPVVGFVVVAALVAVGITMYRRRSQPAVATYDPGYASAPLASHDYSA